MAVTDAEALMGVQQFYGMYTLPMNTIFVPTGTTSDQIVDKALTNGYIIINFEIDTIDGYDKDAASNPVHLSYEGGFDNVDGDGDMYQIEGYNQSQNGFSLEYGDMIFYDSDASASEDYMVIGTH